MILVAQKVEYLRKWGEKILERPDNLKLAVLKSSTENAWFDKKSQWKAIESVARNYLLSPELKKWIRAYPLSENPKNVGIIMAGNIPLVGFHDALSVLVSGHFAKIKLSEKDKYLMPALISILRNVNKEQADRFVIADKLHDIDAVIATGSNNSGNYFESYFKDYPKLIRKNRNSLAILTGEETDEDIENLSRDIMDYYGLGCRSISKIFIRSKKDRERVFESLEKYERIIENEPYGNNFKYNYAIYAMNREDFETNNMIIMKESESLQSRIACLHYEEYEDDEEVSEFIKENEENLQCVVAKEEAVGGKKALDFGETQSPGLFDYADNADTRQFLSEL